MTEELPDIENTLEALGADEQERAYHGAAAVLERLMAEAEPDRAKVKFHLGNFAMMCRRIATLEVGALVDQGEIDEDSLYSGTDFMRFGAVNYQTRQVAEDAFILREPKLSEHQLDLISNRAPDLEGWDLRRAKAVGKDYAEQFGFRFVRGGIDIDRDAFHQAYIEHCDK